MIRILCALLLLANAAMSRSLLRGGLVDIYAETGRQDRVAIRWDSVDASSIDCDGVTFCWEEHDNWSQARTWTLGAGVFLNDNLRFGMRWSGVTAHGGGLHPFDSSVISLEGAFFSHPSGPLSGEAAVRVGLAPGFPSRDPPDTYPLYGLHVPARVYGASLGVRWMATEHAAVDVDLVSGELWAFSVKDVWHLSWLTPRISVLF